MALRKMSDDLPISKEIGYLGAICLDAMSGAFQIAVQSSENSRIRRFRRRFLADVVVLFKIVIFVFTTTHFSEDFLHETHYLIANIYFSVIVQV
jgi:hypothetical protein